MTTTTLQEASKALGLPMPRYGVIRAKQVGIDMRVQRPVNEKKRAKMNEEWEPAAIGMVSISLRRNGKHIAVDGQHRCLVANDQSYNEDIPAAIWEGLTLQQEAALFRLLNTTNKTTAVEAWTVAVTERDPVAVAIKTVLDRHGLSMSPNALKGSFAAVRTAERIVSQDNGVLLFDWAVGLITNVWGDRGDHMNGRVIEGLVLMYQRYAEDIDVDSFKERLAQVKVGQHGLLGEMEAVRTVWRVSAPVAMAHVLVGVYNQKRRAGKGTLAPYLKISE